MSRGGSRQLAALVVAVFAAAVFAACGDSDDSSSGGQPSSNGAATQASGDSGQQGDSGASPEDEAESANLNDRPVRGPDSANVVTPLSVSGGGSDQFRVKGGDNSIQEFGEEGDEEELQEAAETVHGFFVSRAEGDWTRTCSYLSESLREQLKGLAEKSEAKGCPEFLSDFTTELPPAVWRELTTIDAGSFRHEGEQGFLIYSGADGTIYSMPMNEEDGEWKVTGLSSSAIG